jgi:stage V sporulation protein G
VKITDIRIQLIKSPRNKLVAFAEITIDEALVIKDFQIFASDRGAFVGMPSRKMPDGSWRETVFPIDTDLARSISDAILRAFQDEVNRPENNFNRPGPT